MDNPPTAEKCSVCTSPRPPPGAPTVPTDPDDEHKADDTSDFVKDLNRLAHPPTPEELQLRVAELTSDLEGRDAQLREKDSIIEGLRELVSTLRTLLLEERDDRRQVVDQLWRTVRFTYGMLDRAQLALSAHEPATAGAGAGSADTTPPPTPTPTTTTATTTPTATDTTDTAATTAPTTTTTATTTTTSVLPPPVPASLLRTESETTKVESVQEMAKTHEVVELWQDTVASNRERMKSTILARTWRWVSGARERAQEAAETKATELMMKSFILEKKRGGYPLSVMEENFLNVKDHHDGKMYDCEACFDEFSLSDILVLECGHFLCQTCMRAFVVAEIEQGRYSILSCPETECDHKLDSDEVQLALGEARKALYKRYQELMLEDHLARDPNLIRCPKPRCQTPMIKEPSTTMVICPKPSCRYSFCARCKVEWHSDSTCEKYQEWVRENGSAEDRFQTWAEQHTKPCPREEGGCGRPIQKNGGCNHMTCSRCRFGFCWLCMKKYKSGHFSRGGPCAGKQFT